MARASWNGVTVAESEAVETSEGSVYFPPDSVVWDLLVESDTKTLCPWKGTASYYHIVVHGHTNPDAAWVYPETKEAAAHIRGMVAFWKGVNVDAP